MLLELLEFCVKPYERNTLRMHSNARIIPRNCTYIEGLL